MFKNCQILLLGGVLVKIISIGYNFTHGNDFGISRPNGLNEYLFLIIRSTAIFEINGQKLHITPNSMILINKNTPHAFHADGELFINDWIALNISETEHRHLCEKGIKFNKFSSSSDVVICSDIINFIQNENLSESVFKENNIMNMLQIIFNKLQDSFTNNNIRKRYYNELTKIRNRIYCNPAENYSITQLSNEVNLSKSYFQHCYKLYFKTSPIADVINSKIEYAKQLLLSTNFSVATIAEMVGYTNDMQFIKQFKAVTHTTPNKYRNNTCL